MESFKKPAIIRLARRAGIKNVSEDCYETIRNLIMMKLTHILQTSFIVNEQANTKTLMVNDIVEALRLQGKSVCKSVLSNENCPKY